MAARLLSVRPDCIILIVLVPFFMCTTGMLYQIMGYPGPAATLSSAGINYDVGYLHDQDNSAAGWIKEYGNNRDFVYTYTWPGPRILKNQAGITSGKSMFLPDDSYSEKVGTDGYIYLRYNDIFVNDIVAVYPELFDKRNKIHSTDISGVYR